MIRPFSFAGIPSVQFGAGRFSAVPGLAAGYGNTCLIVTGAKSYQGSRWDRLIAGLATAGVAYHHYQVAGEPSPSVVDEAVATFDAAGITSVIAWGGGSVVDAGKAISAMLPSGDPVKPYLEMVGDGKAHNGIKVPFIAVPTTSGTGSEATKNAVLSDIGPAGFKCSLRHDNFVPDHAILDPELMTSCPAEVTASCGMDAFTQLLESYVSTKSNPVTDALAWSGLENIQDNILLACGVGAGDTRVRGAMAYAALMSGITLANAGLGAVHGMAGPMGGLFPIPHGVACGTMLAPVTAATIRKLFALHGPENQLLMKYAAVGFLLAGSDITSDVRGGCDLLIETIYEWTEALPLGRLSSYGITDEDVEMIAASTDNKNNPVPLDEGELKKVIRERL